MVTIDQASHRLDAPPQPRYRGLTLPELRLGRVKLVAISEKCQLFADLAVQYVGRAGVTLSVVKTPDRRPKVPQ